MDPVRGEAFKIEKLDQVAAASPDDGLMERQRLRPRAHDLDGRVVRAEGDDIALLEPLPASAAQSRLAGIEALSRLSAAGEELPPAGADQHRIAGLDCHALRARAGVQFLRFDRLTTLEMVHAAVA